MLSKIFAAAALAQVVNCQSELETTYLTAFERDDWENCDWYPEPDPDVVKNWGHYSCTFPNGDLCVISYDVRYQTLKEEISCYNLSVIRWVQFFFFVLAVNVFALLAAGFYAFCCKSGPCSVGESGAEAASNGTQHVTNHGWWKMPGPRMDIPEDEVSVCNRMHLLVL